MMPIRRPLASCRLLALPFALATVPLAGCPSPKPDEKYDKFLDETEDEREDAMNMKMDVEGALADVNGDFLFALAAVISTTTPLLFYTNVTFVENPDGTGGVMGLSMQPLSSAKCPPDMVDYLEVGEKLELMDVPVDASGAFTIEIAEPVNVTGQANPITCGDIVATLNLQGSIQSENIICGNVTGMVTAPLALDLMGSTFAVERVESIDMLPTMVLGACPAGGAEDSGGSGSGGSESGSGGGETTGG